MKFESLAKRNQEIPILSGHYRRTMWYFARCWLGMAAGIGVFGLGLYWQLVAVQVVGGVLALAAFLWMLSTVSRAQSALCPTCSETMAQGWDAARNSSDGVFTCPQCKSRWRTPATWGFE